MDMVLYPLSAFRAMNKAALNVYQHLLDDGDQKAVVELMQTREELYDYLDYHAYEHEARRAVRPATATAATGSRERGHERRKPTQAPACAARSPARPPCRRSASPAPA
ncbi:MAG: hypothetical protein U5K43_11665 [Halofilum sp. (in: g-proteobacteria)]|nr:hypothetical protein [Halofilum sp. (in: g-proteobacteria)]